MIKCKTAIAGVLEKGGARQENDSRVRAEERTRKPRRMGVVSQDARDSKWRENTDLEGRKKEF